MADKKVEATDLTKWRLEVDAGRQSWVYLTESERSNDVPAQSYAEKFFLGLPTDLPVLPKPDTPQNAALNGANFLENLQLSDGHWGCDYGGPCFLTPGLVFAMYITETPIPREWAIEISRHIVEIVNDDGGWGMHEDDPKTTVLATVLHYVTLRVLGMSAQHPVAVGAVDCLQVLGGVAGVPTWGKVWLAALNLYKWEGVNPIPPEFWSLPDWWPFHPWRWWIHNRVVYLPMSYIYGKQFQMPLNPLLHELRGELYQTEYSKFSFSANKNNVAVSDLKFPPNVFVNTMNKVYAIWENYVRPDFFLNWCQSHVYELIKREDHNTNYNCLAPVNKAWHMLAVYVTEGPNSERMKRHREGVKYYLFMNPTGMRSGGTNGLQVWDTSFAVHATLEAGYASEPRARDTLQKALDFLEEMQFDHDLDDPHRQKRKGGWAFSTKDNGYIVSDAAAEALKSVLLLQEENHFHKVISRARITDCINTLLTLQNPDGGFSAYESIRSFRILNYLNNTELFDAVMVEKSYVECTSSVITTLALFRKHFPGYKHAELQSAITHAVQFIRREQRADGSWYGSWGVCFTYAAMFGLEALALVGEDHASSERARRACEFIIQKQNADGGWGEHWSSCEKEVYVQHEESQVVNTAWALIALMHAHFPETAVLEKGVRFLMQKQTPQGEWKQGAIEGVFNKTCIIGFPNYRLYFPVKALGMFVGRQKSGLDAPVA